jgi:hypothetical protein
MSKIYLFIFVALVSSCATTETSIKPITDTEIEELLIGNWFVSTLDLYKSPGNAISSYTRGHEIFFIQYADIGCNIPLIEVRGTWKIRNRQLFITVTQSLSPRLLPIGTTTNDEILFIDENNLTLKAIDSGRIQLRTKTSTCSVRHF